MNNIVLRPSYWASVSGGKDSLYMLYLLLSNRDKYPLDGVVHFELEIDYPFIKNVVDLMESACKEVGVKFVRLKPEKSWFELYNKEGFPTRICRWCNTYYKLTARKKLDAFLKSQGCYTVYYIGYCADENKRYEKRKNTNKYGISEIYPLVNEGIQEDFILQWAKEQPIFNDYYKYFKRCGCMLCPMATKKELAYQLKYYPDNFERFMNLAEKTEQYLQERYGRKIAVLSGNPKYDIPYHRNIIKNKWLPKLEKEMNESED